MANIPSNLEICVDLTIFAVVVSLIFVSNESIEARVGSAKKKVLFRTERIALSCGSRSKEDRSSDQDCVLSQPHSDALIGLALVMRMQGIEGHS